MTLTRSPDTPAAFREAYPIAWSFHVNTSRWAFNRLEPSAPWAGPVFKEYPGAPLIDLPGPLELSLSLDDAISRRLSCRAFTRAPVSLERLATVLHAGYGVRGTIRVGSGEHLERPVPSGGGLYPLELYVIARRVASLDAGLYHYAPLARGLERLQPLEIPDGVLGSLFLNQPYLEDAAAVLMMTAVVHRSMHKYLDRGYRYILIEAGHVGQNMNLVAAALGLGSFNLGGFFDEALARMFELDLEQEVPIYAVAVGQPASADHVAARLVDSLL